MGEDYQNHARFVVGKGIRHPDLAFLTSQRFSVWGLTVLGVKGLGV